MLTEDDARDRAAGGVPGTLPPLTRSRLAWQAGVGALAQATQGVVGLALLLVGHDAGLGIAASSAAVAAFLVGGSIGRPLQGLALDRVSPTVVLVICGIGHGLAFQAIALAADAGTRPGYAAAAAAAGLTLPPIATRQRVSWPARVAPERVMGVFALISSLQTVTLIAAPALFTAVMAASSSRAAMLTVAWVSAACTVVCGFLDEGARQALTLVRVRLRAYAGPLACTAAVGAVASGVDVAAPILAIDAHHATAAGVLVLIESIGTLVGAVVTARIRRSMLLPGTALQVVGCAALLVPAPLPVTAVAMFVVGAGITPALSTLSMLISQRASGRAESFGWQSTALALGGAVGSVVTGALARIGAHASPGLGLAAAVVALGLVLRLTRRTVDRQ